jgi:hypothetical protein
MNNLTLEEIQLGLEVYEKLLLQEAYLKGDKQSLTEIKLSFKGIKDLGQKALDKFKSLATPEKTFVGILGKLRKETNKEAKEIISFLKKKASEYKGKSIKDIQKDIESLFSEFTGKKLDEALTAKQRIIGGFIALGIYLMSIVPTVASSYDAIDDINPNPDIEMTTPVDLEGGDNDPNTIGFGDAEALASTGGDISHSDVQDGVNAQGVKANLGDSGGAISFGTGEFDASQTDIDKAAQDAVDSLVKNLDGKDLEKVSIDPYGLISNTPGDQDNNPNGPGDTGLDGKRLDTAKKIADKVQDLLKDKYPDADISIGDGITNGDSVDGQKEVPKGSDTSAKTQVAGVSFGDLATGDAPADDDFNPEPAKARLIDPKLELDNRSRYLAILTLFLPLLVDDYDGLVDKIVNSLKLTDKDFPLTRDSVIGPKLKELKAKENKTSEDEEVIKALEWAASTSKSPSTLLNNINKLDPKVALGKRILKKTLRPGSRGQSMGRSGFPGTSQGNTGAQVTSPKTGTTVGESVLLEAKTDFSELPKYNSSKAKSNLGILVPLYASFWSSEPGKAADGSTMPTGFDIDYIEKEYAVSFRKFNSDYPVVTSVVKLDDYQDYKPGEKPGVDSGNNEPLDKKPDGIEPDALKVKGAIDGSSTAVSRLNLINTKDELQLLLKNVLLLTNQSFAKQGTNIKAYMMTIANQVKALRESNPDLDVNKVAKVLMTSAIKNKILTINNKDELKDLIVNVILPNINPVLKKNLSAMRGAIIGAGNAYKFDASGLDEMSKKKIRQRDKLAKSIKPRTIKQYGKKEGESAAYAIATNMVKEDCGCGCNDCNHTPMEHTINELICDLVYEELCKRGKAYIAARKRAGEKSSAYLSGRAVKVCKGQIKGAGGKRKKSYRRKNESLYNQLKPQVLKHLEETLFNDPHFAIISEYNVKEANIDESLRNWFKKENWVRIDTQGNIAGKCGTMPKGKATQRCLPRAKAMSLTKAQRRATARKKVRGSKKGKQFVRNTKKARVSFKKK